MPESVKDIKGFRSTPDKVDKNVEIYFLPTFDLQLKLIRFCKEFVVASFRVQCMKPHIPLCIPELIQKL